jgi:hypothetical protein
VRRLLATAALLGAPLIALNPVEAKSIWLKCGNQVINLDSTKEIFSLTMINKVYQGRAVFNPGQIDFEYKWVDFGKGDGLKYAYSIDRKSLEYTKTSLDRFVLGFSDSGWVPQKSTEESPNPEFGKCSIIKTPPTAGNKI